MLRKPGYISQAEIDDPILRYDWHDWQALRYCEPIDEEFVKRYAMVETSAVVALTIAMAEWLVYRYERLSADPRPLLYLESAWCANVDRAYSWPIELPKEEWQGPVRRPMLVGVILLNHALYEAEEVSDTMQQPALMANLVEHVLPDRAVFRRWRDRCVDRIRALYTANDDPFADLFGPDRPVLVPREVFDPEQEFRADMATRLVDRFLRSIEHSANPFLLSPAQMNEEGFKGTPYAI